MLISDGSYKGVNLLKNDSLKVSFNEDRSSYLNIAGVDASSRALGICAAKWDNLGAVISPWPKFLRL